jgi:autotransporter-associated beta strand protein
MNTPSSSRLIHPSATAALLFAVSSVAYSASDTWKTAPTTGNWNTAGNWVAAGQPGNSTTGGNNTDIATFTGVSSNATVNLAASRNMGGLTFDGAGAYTVSTTSSSVRFFFTRGGTTQMTSSTTASQDLSLAFMRLGAGISGSNNYTFLNNASSSSNTFTLGAVRNDSGTASTVIFGGSNTGLNKVSGSIDETSGNVLAVNKTGSGTWILDTGNSYTGGTTLDSGTLGVGSSNALGTGNLTINGGTLSASGSTRTLANNVTVGGNFSVGGLGAAVVLNGTINLGGVTRSITLAANSVTLGGVGSNGGLAIESNSASRSLTLNGAGSNTYTGLTTVNGGTVTLAKTGGAIAVAGDLAINAVSSAGTVLLAASDQIANTRTATIGTGATLDLATFNQSLTGVVLNGGNITSSTGTLTGLTNAFDLRAGSVGAALAGSVGLTKSTGGTVTLTGNNTFTGVTTLGAGTVSVVTIGDGGVASGNLGSATSAAANLVFDGGTLQYTGANSSTDRNFTINNGKTATVDVTTNSLTLAGATTATSGALTKTGSGTLILSGNNLHTGTTTIAGGTLNIVTASGLGSGTITTSTSSTSAKIGLDAASASVVTLANAVDTSATSTNLMTFSPGAGKTIALNGLITGSGVLKLSGGGDLSVGNASNSYSGGTEIGTGRVFIADDAALGTGAVNFGTGSNSHLVATANITSSRAFTLGGTSFTANFDTNGNNVSLSGAITPVSTGGKLNKLGAGTLTLSGNNTYTGATTVTAGTLVISGSGSINSSSGITLNGGTFKNNSSVALTSPLTVNSGTVGGTNLSGVALTIGINQTVSPGNSPGTLAAGATTFSNGGTYVWEINNAAGTAGTSWDLLTAPSVDVSGLSAGGFSVNLVTLVNPSNAAGLADNFNSAVSQSFLFVDAAATITSFAGTAFTIDAAAFQNPYGGTWSIKRGDDVSIVGGDDTQLYVSYTAIPEPSAYAACLGLGVIGLVLHRRRRKGA